MIISKAFKMNIATKIALLAVFSGPALAASDSDFGKCTAITSDADRLICFDATAKKAQTLVSQDSKADQQAAPESAEKASESVDTAGAWDVSSDIDPMTDKPKYYAALNAKTGEGMFGKPIYILARCVQNKTEVLIMWNTILGIGDSPKVTYRLDKGTPTASSWSKSTSGNATFFPGSPVKFLKQLLEAKSMVASVESFSSGAVTAVFDLTGIETAMKDIRKECNW
ncbi:MAG TPA: hypothetical protein DD666_00695 [Advenella kashmirensis]|uniref:Type VI secretion system-associated protein TagO n=1 Tax=Advenella kashmirensis TaxID=310575 RepID=A0A356LA99_9BURK|nr:hypothetical protein [Advenella kashmirensis]